MRGGFGRSQRKTGGRGGWERAVVVGGGVAGLLAARAVSEVFEQVMLIEQDASDAVDFRKGTPQARHLHVMLARGSTALEELFPGLNEELSERGAQAYDHGEMHLKLPTGWVPHGPVGIPLLSMSRSALESVLRERVTRLPAVEYVTSTRVTGLRTDEHGQAVTGVAVSTGEGSGAEDSVLDADLVIDASGRNSRLPRWLAERGLPQPRTHAIDIGLNYTSRFYAADAADPRDWVASVQLSFAPHLPARGGGAFRVEGNRWLVSLVGAAGEVCPTDEAGYRRYAQGLDNPHMAEVVEACTPLTPLYRYHHITSRRRDYHRMERYPQRLMVIGDAVCSFNPVYGQGMTVAALQAQELARLLGRYAGQPQPPDLARRFQQAVARSVRLPWFMAAAADLGWRTERLPVHLAAGGKGFGHLLKKLPHDPVLYQRFAHVWHMEDSPLALAHPRTLPHLFP